MGGARLGEGSGKGESVESGRQDFKRSGREGLYREEKMSGCWKKRGICLGESIRVKEEKVKGRRSMDGE